MFLGRTVDPNAPPDSLLANDVLKQTRNGLSLDAAFAAVSALYSYYPAVTPGYVADAYYAVVGGATPPPAVDFPQTYDPPPKPITVVTYDPSQRLPGEVLRPDLVGFCAQGQIAVQDANGNITCRFTEQPSHPLTPVYPINETPTIYPADPGPTPGQLPPIIASPGFLPGPAPAPASPRTTMPAPAPSGPIPSVGYQPAPPAGSNGGGGQFVTSDDGVAVTWVPDPTPERPVYMTTAPETQPSSSKLPWILAALAALVVMSKKRG